MTPETWSFPALFIQSGTHDPAITFARHDYAFDKVQSFFANLPAVIKPATVLAIYGPFRYGGNYTSDSNAEFDSMLRARDPGSGIRDFEAVNALANAAGFRLLADHRMPANNQTLVFTTAAAA